MKAKDKTALVTLIAIFLVIGQAGNLDADIITAGQFLYRVVMIGLSATVINMAIRTKKKS